jgi:hypothetical protein
VHTFTGGFALAAPIVHRRHVLTTQASFTFLSIHLVAFVILVLAAPFASSTEATPTEGEKQTIARGTLQYDHRRRKCNRRIAYSLRMLHTLEKRRRDGLHSSVDS